jgi:D-alanyl-lipoteichoic acid acyltransferase DltB (MBOAT superfamily)
MLFNSLRFALFFGIFFPTYWLLPHRVQNLLLLAGSYLFYGSWDWRFLSLLILSTAMDYTCGLLVDREQDPRRRKIVVGLSMALNLGLLGYFKYVNFFADSLAALLDRLGLHVPFSHLEIALPIGISFYTFQSMSYVIDVYRHDVKPTRNPLDFAAFVAFFPHLVAGPIMRPTTLLPQIERPRRFDASRFHEGVYLIVWGLVKKVVIADNLARLADPLWNRAGSLGAGEALLAIYAFAFQIYCDFAGYTDVARGVSKTLGFELALNFHLPYFSRSPKEFWSRWHISLSTWLRDYLYVPLGGNRGGPRQAGNLMLAASALACGAGLLVAAAPSRASSSLYWIGGALALLVLATSILRIRSIPALTQRNLILTMILGGLWHGAAWTYVVWGAFHGLWLALHRAWDSRLAESPIRQSPIWPWVARITTFHLVCLGWVFFRATSLDQAFALLGDLAATPVLPPRRLLAMVAALVLPLLAYQAIQHRTADLDFLRRVPLPVRSVAFASLFYALVLAGDFGGSQFIYFQF